MSENVKAASGDTLVSRQYAKRSRMGEIWHRMKRNKGAVVGMCIIIALILIMIYTAIFVSYDSVTAMDVTARLQGPSAAHPFGTDDMGRDLFLRVLYGTKYSIAIGVGAVCVSLIVGLILGAVAGYFGGIVDDIIMRLSDILASIPATLMGMVIVTVLGQSLRNLLFAVGVTAIPAFIRITRSSVLTVRNQEYVEAARSIGMSNLRIIFNRSCRTACPRSSSPLPPVSARRSSSPPVFRSSASAFPFRSPSGALSSPAAATSSAPRRI